MAAMDDKPSAIGPELFGGTREEVAAGIKALLLARSVPEAEIDAAIEEDRLDLLVIDRLMLPSSQLHTPGQVWDSAGIKEELAERLWRALGFPDADDDVASFTDQDVEALRIVNGLVVLGLASEETAVQMTRVMGSSMARLAEALVAATDAGDVDHPPVFLTAPDGDRLAFAQELAFASEVVLPNMERLIVYSWRRHIQAATRRRATMLRDRSGGDTSLPELTVGFADMVGFTALSQQLSGVELARVVDRFEELAHDTVVRGGGRVVKMIGDEVMFVTERPLAGAVIALDLVEAYADDDLLSDVRAGLATGPVLARDGDFFGSVVNRAHRIVNIADAGSVLVSPEVRRAVGERADLEWQPLKSRELKDLGRIDLFALSRRGAPALTDERRTGARFRRLNDLRHELMSRGEAVWVSALHQSKGGEAPRVEGDASLERLDRPAEQVDDVTPGSRTGQ